MCYMKKITVLSLLKRILFLIVINSTELRPQNDFFKKYFPRCSNRINSLFPITNTNIKSCNDIDTNVLWNTCWQIISDDFWKDECDFLKINSSDKSTKLFLTAQAALFMTGVFKTRKIPFIFFGSAMGYIINSQTLNSEINKQ